ncbi:dihydroorotate dehydrogenase [Acidobacteria bacterium AH-259-L09]|nr:dihydroorotate dehydrogenase [Acidobacteria bacterium AH-259-L09]
MDTAVDLSVDISGLHFKNPVLAASGTFGYGLEFTRFFDISELGGFCTKGLSLEPLPGNPPGRITETPAGMLNAIGLENVGAKSFIRDKLPPLERYDTHIIANIFGKTIEEFVAIAGDLNPHQKVSALELNISCPNIKEGGIQFGHDPDMTYKVVEAVKKISNKPVWVKLSPNVTDITVFARVCEDAGADALTLVNTFLAMSIDVNKRRPMLSNVTGGLSGPAIRPMAVRLVHQAAQTVDIPVVGIGGITSARDTLEFMVAGAMAVQIGTANYFDPMVCVKVIRGLRRYCEENNISDIKEIIGTLEVREGQFLYY